VTFWSAVVSGDLTGRRGGIDRGIVAATRNGRWLMTEEARDHLEEIRSHLRRAADEGNPDAGDLAEHLDAYLAGAQSPEEQDDILDRLREGMLRFEANHPKLSHAIQGVIDSLTASGI
jgi:hypothetical protein